MSDVKKCMKYAVFTWDEILYLKEKTRTSGAE